MTGVHNSIAVAAVHACSQPPCTCTLMGVVLAWLAMIWAWLVCPRTGFLKGCQFKSTLVNFPQMSRDKFFQAFLSLIFSSKRGRPGNEATSMYENVSLLAALFR